MTPHFLSRRSFLAIFVVMPWALSARASRASRESPRHHYRNGKERSSRKKVWRHGRILLEIRREFISFLLEYECLPVIRAAEQSSISMRHGLSCASRNDAAHDDVQHRNAH